jgi:glycosyltransferase involved in cell wall biosynthesis
MGRVLLLLYRVTQLRFLTSTPLDIRRGSGTYAGIATLAAALRALGHEVRIDAPRLHLPVYAAERWLFNAQLRPVAGFDAVVGFDLDGYRLAGHGGVPHIASLKGVIADELRFQKGGTRLSMSLQARWEARHVRRADAVITTSQYAANRVAECYGREARIVPEVIDLVTWRGLLAANPGRPDPAWFTVLAVCRLYRRKRIDVLLRAAKIARIPNLRVRIVGDGPEAEEFRTVWRELALGQKVEWLGDVTRARLAEEYNACNVFCLPSVQEGFGIVFLEAMAAGKPIAAARAAAVPEVVPQGLLAEPDNPESLAAVLEQLHADAALRTRLSEEGLRRAEQFDAPVVAERFLKQIRQLRSSEGDSLASS